MHRTPLIATIAAAFVLALGFGFVAVRLRVPPLVGYLLAGIVLGRLTPGLVTDAGLAAQLADVGVILLMFGVGLHFSFADLFKTRRVRRDLQRLIRARCVFRGSRPERV